MMKQLISLRVNGELVETYVPVHKTLLEVLREDIGLTGTKHGCEVGECGMCTVLVDGEPVLSCLVLPLEVQGRDIRTVEGMAQEGLPHPLQRSFAELNAAQCGYCTPAMLMTAKALLERNPQPTRDEVREALAGVLCRCTGYVKIIDAVQLAGERMEGGLGTLMEDIERAIGEGVESRGAEHVVRLNERDGVTPDEVV